MKKLITFITFVVCACNARAQFGYKFTYSTGNVYTPLTGATDANGGDKWMSSNYSIPLDFSYKLGPDTLDHFNMLLGWLGPVSTPELSFIPFNSFTPLGNMMLFDRGNLADSLPSLSSVNYMTVGTSPNRIFKLEFRDAGIFNEYYRDSTLEDSLSLQIWLYETSSVLEFHYGPSALNKFLDYSGPGFDFSYYQNMDLGTETIDYCYFLTGDPAAPVLDSTEGDFGADNLSVYPANGTVYRFTPYASATGIGDPELKSMFNVFPSTATTTLFISNKNNTQTDYEIISVNGQKMNSSGSLVPGNNALDIQTLSAGMYLLQVRTDKGNATYRFIKQ